MNALIASIKKGICIGCIEKPKEDLIKPIIQSKKVQLEETKRKPIVKAKPTKQKWWSGTLFKCVVGCLYPYWDSEGNDYDENKNLKTMRKPIQDTRKINCSQKWECIVPPCDFIDANGCLIE